MQAASSAYKEIMRRKWRNSLSYLRVTIGVINQRAQASAYIDSPELYTYYSDLSKPLDNYRVSELYAACDQDYTTADGSMYFLPRETEDVVLNQGIVSIDPLGPITISFPTAYDIKGMTIEFGKAYPVDFRIETGSRVLDITGNTDGHFVTDEIFESATFIRITASRMINGQSRLRINQITMGIGIYFGNREILAATKKEHISPISEELPTIDFSLTVSNRGREYDIENDESTINYLEIGQEIEVLYGQGMDDGSIEWMPGVCLNLKEWSADDTEMEFHASDRFDGGLDEIYYHGMYRPNGISLYDLAVHVFEDAGVDPRTYWIDPYLKTIRVVNPMPAVTHQQSLQLIANAGRSVIYQDRAGRIIIKSSFMPDMTASSSDETYFSNVAAVLDQTVKADYALTGLNHTPADGSIYFLPRAGQLLNMGYVSDSVSDEEGYFGDNPIINIAMETSYKCFGIKLGFGTCYPETVVLHAYLQGELQEEYTVSGMSQVYALNHEFPEMDFLQLEFTKGAPNNRIVLHSISFGDITDYRFDYGIELTGSPKGTQLEKVRELQVVRTLYNLSAEIKELLRETVDTNETDNRHIFYFSNPSYDLAASITDPEEGQSVSIISSSAYYAEVEISGVSGQAEVVISGKEYEITQAKSIRKLNQTGVVETWENPLISSASHAADLAEWIGDYLKSDRDYELSYRGDPRIDANDLAYLENIYVPDMMVRIYDHTLKFDGGLSGTVKARRDMSNVAAT